MKTKGLISVLLLITLPVFNLDCHDKPEDQIHEDTWDVDVQGIPRFVGVNYIELDKIYRISKFRSSIGHDYSDAFEHCRSMKHYFEPKAEVDWSTIHIYSPVSGKITRLEQEWAGARLEIESDVHPAFRFSIFHINLAVQLQVESLITAGELLGTHIGSQTMSDISVIVNDPAKQGKMISWFEVLTDSVFKVYSNRGVSNRAKMIITKEMRDNNPLTCSGDTFISADTLENWVVLK
jgi:hypothetical protein